MMVRWSSKALVAALAIGAGCSPGTGGGGGGTVVDAGSTLTDVARTDLGAREGGAACATATTCSSCAAMGPCGWCGRTGRCLQGGSSGSADMSCTGADWAFTGSRCGADGGVLPPPDAAAQCAMATACGTCTAMGPCGWCTRTNRCQQGGSMGSADMSCTGMDWDFTGRTCPRPDAGPTCDGVPRDCGLTLAGAVRTCTPGQMLTAGCNANCAPALGSCTGDAVMQICPGNATTAPCSGTAVIASNDDAPTTAMCRADGGTNLCPVTTFMCPSNGMYTIWVGAYDSTETATCVPAVR